MNCPPVKYNNIVIQELDDEILIYDLLKDKAFCLNKTAAMIWQECDGTKTVGEISRAVSKNFGVTVSENIVWLALNQFKVDDLFEKDNSPATPFDGLSRREIVKRIGFSSLVALPVIASVVAPTAISAASTATCGCSAPSGARSRTGGCSCNSSSDCCTNSCSFSIPNVFGLCTAGTASGAASCCSTVACSPFGGMNGIVQPGCRCNFIEDCISGVCGGAGAAPICGA